MSTRREFIKSAAALGAIAALGVPDVDAAEAVPALRVRVLEQAVERWGSSRLRALPVVSDVPYADGSFVGMAHFARVFRDETESSERAFVESLSGLIEDVDAKSLAFCRPRVIPIIRRGAAPDSKERDFLMVAYMMIDDGLPTSGDAGQDRLDPVARKHGLRATRCGEIPQETS